MHHTKNLIIFSLALFLHKILFPGVASLECGPPFVPMNGSHTNVKQTYTPGEKIEYSCDEGYHRVGKKQSTCINGSWTGYMPFCDTQLPDPMSVEKEGTPGKLPTNQRVTDNSTTTCLPMSAGDCLKIDLNHPAILQVIKLFLNEGSYQLSIETPNKGGKKTLCEKYGTLNKGNWISIECEQKTNSICIREKHNSIQLCEVEMYGSDELSCNIPPPQQYFPNGHFIINRTMAILKCSGSNSKIYVHSTCHDNKWYQTGKSFSCEGHSDATDTSLETRHSDANDTSLETRHSDANDTSLETSHSDANDTSLETIIVASVVTVCFVLGCLAAVLVCLYMKRQTVFVVVRHPKEHCRGGHATPAPEEAEYATVNYSEIPSTPAQTTIIPKNTPANLPDLLEYTEPQDQDSSRWEENLHSSQTNVYIQPQDALQIGNGQHFICLKKSSFYGD